MPARFYFRGSFGSIAVALLGAVLVAGCGSAEMTLPGPVESNARPAGDEGGSSSEYCAAVERIDATDESELDDPAKAIEALAALSEVAPDELKPSFEVLAGVVDELAGLDESDPEYITRSLELVFDPAVSAAAGRIDEFTIQECGIDLDDGGADDGSTDPFDDFDTSGDLPSDVDDDAGGESGDVDLEDIDDIKEANGAASWSSKLRTTTITNDTYVTLAADAAEPVTPEEALAACEAVRVGLVAINPQVTVEIRNGEVAVAASPAGGTCAAQ